jgi:hypothetical protein
LDHWAVGRDLLEEILPDARGKLVNVYFTKGAYGEDFFAGVLEEFGKGDSEVS